MSTARRTPFDLSALRSAVSQSQFVLQPDHPDDADLPNVCEYMIKILADNLGIKHAFGCPGDFAFAVDDAIEDNPNMEFVLTTNELNASYAADAYARVHGCSVLTTTYGVGELSAINGVMGAKSERVGAVFHMVGEPGMRLEHTGRVVHHTLGEGLSVNGPTFMSVSEQAACVSWRVSDPSAVPREFDRVVEVALKNSQPCYILVPKDVGQMKIPKKSLEGYTSMFATPVPRDKIRSLCHPESVEAELQCGLRAIKERLSNAKSLVVMVSYMVDRLGLTDKCLAVIEKLGCPFVSTPMDKAVLPESHPQFAGTYKGQMSVSSVRELVESTDTIIDIGGILFDDLSTGFGTASILKENLIQLNGREAAICLGHPTESFVQNKATSYRTCYLGDVLDELINDSSLPKFTPAEPIIPPKKWPSLDEVQGETSTGIMYASIGSILQEFLVSGDIFVCEVGTSSGLYSNMVLPGGSRFICQTLWGSIGYATPAVLGACLSSPDTRVVMVTGDGAHLMSANELGTMAKYKIKPIVVVLNNGVYGVEEFLEKNTARSYNDLGGWKYAQAAKAMGCDDDWITVRVDTVADLVSAMNKARDDNKAAYIEAQMAEILLDPMSSSKLSLMYFDNPQ